MILNMAIGAQLQNHEEFVRQAVEMRSNKID